MKWLKMGQEISEDDLIAFHLHELSPRRERVVAHALAASARLAAESAAIAAMLRTVKDSPRPIGQAAYTRTWRALRPALVPHAGPVAVRPRWRTPMLAGAALTGVAAGVWVAAHSHRSAAGSVARTDAVRASREARLTASGEPAGNETAQAAGAGTTGAPIPAPSSGLRGTRHTGLYRPDPRHGAPPVHLLALAPRPGAPADRREERPPAWPDSTPQPLTPQPAPLVAAAEQMAAAEEMAAKSPATLPPGVADAAQSKARVPKPGRIPHPADLMLGVGGTFILPHSSLTAGTEPRTQTATHAIAAIAAFHQQIRPALGYRVTLSYTRPDFQYTYLNRSGSINSRIFEAAGTSVLRGPHRGRLSTSFDAGAALLAFVPDRSDPSVSYVYRAAGVLGAKVDYAPTRHLAARASYRAQVFCGPDFRFNGGTIPVATSVVESNEPALGIVYRFGKVEEPAKR